MVELLPQSHMTKYINIGMQCGHTRSLSKISTGGKQGHAYPLMIALMTLEEEVVRSVCVYGPQSGRTGGERERFYDDLGSEWDLHSAGELVLDQPHSQCLSSLPPLPLRKNPGLGWSCVPKNLGVYQNVLAEG